MPYIKFDSDDKEEEEEVKQVKEKKEKKKEKKKEMENEKKKKKKKTMEKEKKGKKEAKEKKEEEEEEDREIEVMDTSSTGKKEKKKKKKKEKKNDEDKEEKKKKKKEKKKRKREETEEEEEKESDEVDGEREKKKKKKQKKNTSVKEEEREEREGDVEKSKKSEDKKKKKKKKSEAEDMEVEEEGGEVNDDETVKQYKKDNNMTVTGGAENKPFLTFKEASQHFSSDLMKSCSSFDKPTPIQAQCWPLALKKRDIVGIAETGSGKTLAFILPALVHLQERIKSGEKIGKKSPGVLIVAPTRELATQITEVSVAAGKPVGIRTCCIYGGVAKEQQKKQLKAGVQIIVATPGRLQDLINEGCFNLDNITFVVLDEADRMLDQGFEQDIRSILKLVTKQHQTLMFSATWPETIQTLAQDFLCNPAKVVIGSEDLSANHRVDQKVEVVEPRDKEKKLIQLLNQYHKSRTNRVLIFVLYKKEAARVESMLNSKGWKAAAIHGDASQAQRHAALNKFKDGSNPLLVATDVAARGLDIPDVEYVINYSFPLTVEDYVHRIGRTGRAGKTGVSHTFFTNFDKNLAGDLVNVLKEANQPVPQELIKFGPSIKKKKEHALYGSHFRGGDRTPMKASTHIKFE